MRLPKILVLTGVTSVHQTLSPPGAVEMAHASRPTAPLPLTTPFMICRHGKRSVENTRSGVAVGAGSVSLYWWLNTQNVSFEFWEAGPRELPGIVVVPGGPGRLSAPPEDRDFAMSNTFHAGAARAAASCLVLGSWVGVRQQLRHS